MCFYLYSAGGVSHPGKIDDVDLERAKVKTWDRTVSIRINQDPPQDQSLWQRPSCRTNNGGGSISTDGTFRQLALPGFLLLVAAAGSHQLSLLAKEMAHPGPSSTTLSYACPCIRLFCTVPFCSAILRLQHCFTESNGAIYFTSVEDKG